MLGNLFSERIARDPAWDAWGRGDDVVSGNTSAGVSVSQGAAQSLVTVYTCVTFIAEAIAALPVDIYRDVAGQRVEVAKPRWLDRPNRERSWQEFAHEFVSSLLIDGNAYVLPIVNGSGRTAEAYVLNPGAVSIVRNQQNGSPEYSVNGKAVPAGAVYHARSYPVPGELKGLSPIDACRETIGTGLALERYAGRFFGGSSTPSGVIQAPGNLSADQAELIKSRWESFHRGVSRAHGIAVLSGGAEYRPITIAPEAAQFLQSRNFTAAQIAALFKMPPELVGASLMGSSGITYANITDRWNELIRRWLPWIEQLRRMVSSMLPGPGETGWVAEIDTDAYARADIATRYGAYATGISSGFLSPDEARAEEDLPPLSTGTDGERELTLDEFALAVQKMYLGVGVVITPDEARRRLGLDEPFVQTKTPGQQSHQSFPTEGP